MEIAASFQMWFTLAMVGVVILLYMTEWVTLELTSLCSLSVLLVFFYLFPVPGDQGSNLLGPDALLRGFANPALLTVLALLVVGEALVKTGALDSVAQLFASPKVNQWTALAAMFLVVAIFSAFLNNTPVVVIFIPILQSIAEKFGENPSRVMMPLSYAAILGGMTTLIGSSTNLLVSSVLVEQGFDALGFFEFTEVGVMLAGIGLVYVVLVLPRLLKDRVSLAGRMAGAGRQFVSQIVVPEDSELVGSTAVAGFFKSLPDITVRMIQRGERAVLPPFESIAVEPGDVLIVAATRRALMDAAKKHPGLFHPPLQAGRDEGRERERVQTRGGEEEPGKESEQLMGEAMITPSSRLIGMNLAQIGFRHRYGVVVLGIQRRARMIRQRMTEIRLEAGDVLLVQGPADRVGALRVDRDMVLLSGSFATLPKPHHAVQATLAFLLAIGLAALGVVPIVISAIAAAAAMIAMGAINLRQAVRALDRRIVLLVANGLALADALQVTGGAAYIAGSLMNTLGTDSPAVVVSAFFLITALFTNILSNNACALLFTPIAISLAGQIGVPVHVMAIAVVLAANCSFASPVGYQTNLMVLGPGRYLFSDFVRGGLPLTLLIWLAFSFLAPWYWNF